MVAAVPPVAIARPPAEGAALPGLLEPLRWCMPSVLTIGALLSGPATHSFPSLIDMPVYVLSFWSQMLVLIV